MKRLSILRASAIAASCCFGVWVDRCSSSLALHLPFGLFLIITPNFSFCLEVHKTCLCLVCLSLTSEAFVVGRICALCMCFLLSLLNINIFQFIHFFQFPSKPLPYEHVSSLINSCITKLPCFNNGNLIEISIWLPLVNTLKSIDPFR